ncbi:MAG: ATP-binding protein, partial [Cyclobacteriaceae bacterium]|nr:ATP-binding protein [Cyclobacteriaceae bacterium]
MPHTLIEFGLIEAINELAKRINSLDQITIEVNNHGLETRMEEIYEISLYRIVQEWVNNILKYGNAGLVTIQFTSDDNELTLTIEDDGTGFDKNRLKNSKGNGWKNINSRVQQLGGSIDFDTTAGMAGSILIINVPLSAKNIRVAT